MTLFKFFGVFLSFSAFFNGQCSVGEDPIFETYGLTLELLGVLKSWKEPITPPSGFDNGEIISDTTGVYKARHIESKQKENYIQTLYRVYEIALSDRRGELNALFSLYNPTWYSIFKCIDSEQPVPSTTFCIEDEIETMTAMIEELVPLIIHRLYRYVHHFPYSKRSNNWSPSRNILMARTMAFDCF